jgi:hypothetical protein
VRNFIEVRNNGWPQDWRFDLSFEERYSPKDGPSAAVACALLLNSLVTGKANDPEFAVTGDMNADGTVRPIGGVAAKIRGATQGKCSVVAIPVKNEGTLADMLLTDGPSPFARIQIFSISSFDEAEALATSERSEKVDAALREMKAVQDLLLREPSQMGAWLRNPHVVTKLHTVLSHAPNHLSAKYLLLAGAGKTPRSLSLAGSLDAIEHAASELVSAIKLGGQSADSLRKDVVGSSITRLQNLRARCDPRVQPYADAVIRFGEAVKELQDRPPNTAARGQVMVKAINAAASAADSEMSRLASDPSIREALEK